MRRRQKRRRNTTGVSLSEIMPTALSLSEMPFPPPVSLGPVEGRQHPNETRQNPQDSLDLAGEEKPSSDLADTSHRLSQRKEVPKPSWDTEHVMAWHTVRLPTPVYVRVDRSGAYHSYPDLGGPFQNLDAIKRAFRTYARGNSTDASKETPKDRVVRESLFWSDGTSKVSTSLERAKREIDNVDRLVKALLDTKKDDDENFKYQLKDIVHWQSICEGRPRAWYYHLNITMTAKGADDDANLFFAEVTLDMPGGYFLSSFCGIEPNNKDKVRCHGCMNNGSTDMKHPTSHFDGGHVNTHFPLGFGPCNDKQCCFTQNEEEIKEEEELRKEEEERIRESLDYLDDVDFMENLCNRRAKHLALHPRIQEDEEMDRKN